MPYLVPTIDTRTIKSQAVLYLDDAAFISTCNGSPEGVLDGDIGSLVISDTGALYKKSSALGTLTGWVEVVAGTISGDLTVGGDVVVNGGQVDISGSNPLINLIDTDGGDDDAVISLNGDILSTTVGGGTPVQQKSNGYIIGVGRTLPLLTTTVNSSGAGPDNLHNYSLPAGSLAANGDFCEIIQAGSFAADDDNKSVSTLFGGQAIATNGIVDIDAQGWLIYTLITRLTATTVRASYGIWWGLTTITSANVVDALAAGMFSRQNSIDLPAVADLNANAMAILVQARGVNANDVSQNLTKVTVTQMS